MGVDISSLHAPDSSAHKGGDNNELEDVKARFNDFSRSVHGYSRKFTTDNTQQDISVRIENFKQKIHDL